MLLSMKITFQQTRSFNIGIQDHVLLLNIIARVVVAQCLNHLYCFFPLATVNAQLCFCLCFSVDYFEGRILGCWQNQVIGESQGEICFPLLERGHGCTPWPFVAFKFLQFLDLYLVFLSIPLWCQTVRVLIYTLKKQFANWLLDQHLRFVEPIFFCLPLIIVEFISHF